jgi:hypothetical protein
MSARLELLKADITDELERLEQEFARVRPKLELASEQVPVYDRGAIG